MEENHAAACFSCMLQTQHDTEVLYATPCARTPWKSPASAVAAIDESTDLLPSGGALTLRLEAGDTWIRLAAVFP